MVVLPPSFNPWRIPSGELCKHLRVGTEINVKLFTSLLQGFDPVKGAFVLTGLKEGFRLGLGTFGPYPPTRLWIESFVPVPESRGRITTYLEEEVALRRIFGPFEAVPATVFCDGVNVAPMSEVLRSDGRYRTVTNLSAGGPESSINGFILDSAAAVVLPDFPAGGTELRRSRPRCRLGSPV